MKNILNIFAVICAIPLAEFLPISIINGAVNPFIGILLIAGVMAAAGGSAYFAVRHYEETHIPTK